MYYVIFFKDFEIEVTYQEEKEEEADEEEPFIKGINAKTGFQCWVEFDDFQYHRDLIIMRFFCYYVNCVNNLKSWDNYAKETIEQYEDLIYEQ